MEVMTVGDIARELGVDRDAVAYAVRRTNIQAVGRAGIVRLFPGGCVSVVRHFLRSKGPRRKNKKQATVLSGGNE